jgi:hypothetical protein
MKRLLSLAVAFALVVMCGHFVWAGGQEMQTSKAANKQGKMPGAVMVEAVTASATVTAIDAAARTLTLKLPDGTTRSYKVDQAVKNFDQIKVGDQVKATYAESVAIFVRKSSEQPAAGEVSTVQVAPKGAKPGIIMTDTSEIIAKAEAIDYKKRTITLKGPEGNLATFKVDKSVKRFKNVRVGDDLVIRVTNAMVIAVEKP